MRESSINSKGKLQYAKVIWEKRMVSQRVCANGNEENNHSQNDRTKILQTRLVVCLFFGRVFALQLSQETSILLKHKRKEVKKWQVRNK